MLENQFIRFTSERQTGCEIPIPIVMGYAGTAAIFPYGEEGEIITCQLMVEGSDTPLITEWESCDVNGEMLISVSEIFDPNQMEGLLKNGQCFYLKLSMPDGMWYSNTLQYYSSFDGLSVVKYRCSSPAFGFPFDRVDGYIQATLPINLKNPQLKQEDKTYVKRNGEVVVLMAKYYKEWEAESEYLPEDMHDMIVAALSCDYVYIDDVRMTKSDSYEIDWSNTIKKACGQKLAKATWKMRANVMERNSNC